jgi:NAD(P)-dependent dehydrogenase (short-subunit alcohol dehydrogenase family)
MTGATAGIGAAAAKLLAKPGTRLIIGARGGNVLGAEVLHLDLASLASVRHFADAVVSALAGEPIAALVLNAGGQRPDVEARSADGFELTFAVNHLSHYLLARLLLPHMTTGGRIVITSSDTHDPAEKTGVPPPRHANAAWLADPATAPQQEAPTVAGMRAYSTSKLCNMMTVRSLAAHPDVVSRHITVLAYNPGLTPGTGLVRSQPWAVRTLVWPLLPMLQPFVGFMNSLAAAGGALAALATDAVPPSGRVYASLRKGALTWPDPSELARDDIATAKLWQDSAAMVGLPA